MCGDLNRGLIPRNPMGQYLNGEPYPFELIKNKTLQYLSKTLPYLKEEIDNIPKVARFVKPSEFFENHSKRHARQANLEDLNKQIENVTNVQQMTTIETNDNNSSNLTKQNRQNGCDGNVICQAIESLKEEGPFSKSFLSNVVSAVGNVASINNVVSLIDQYGQSSNQTNPSSSSSQRFAISQLLSSIGSESGSSSNNNNNNNNAGSSYSPLLSTPKFASKRKTSPDVEDFISSDGMNSEKPQTPCMSTEEYISPTFARNYQGVWKYVVQIPNEG
ncbi:hypothetical protein BLA29_006591 [Euroglyphus maynei]|uniref:Uncharacterized protein n=1 Tax=Euroglyphus maynei TaxID=6958 RepID=A0A1Y3AZZ9_EURMA|nr:hypothetical protein BLA29_006591 [Euroglyphus maynei]